MSVIKDKVTPVRRKSLLACAASSAVANHELRTGIFFPLRKSRVWLETTAAPRLVHSTGTHYDKLFAFHKPLCVYRRIAAPHANSKQLGDLFSNGEKPWHRFERAAAVVRVESGDDDALSQIGELSANVNDLFTQKLRLVDANDFGPRGKPFHDFGGFGDVI